jgi:chromosome segregation ATPase
MKKTVSILFIALLLISGCSSLSFIPTPAKATLATTDYVNQSMQKMIDETTNKVIEQSKSIMDEALKADREKMDSLRSTMENQQKDVQAVLAKMEEIDALSGQMRDMVGRMKKDLNEVKAEMLDSIDVVWVSVRNLEKVDQTIQTNLAQIEASIVKLQQIDTEFTALTNQMKLNIEALPKETLMKLRDAIGKFYEAQIPIQQEK